MIKEVSYQNEKQRLKDVIKEETRSYHMLVSTLQGFNQSKVNCCNLAMNTQWIENDEVFAVPSEKIHGARPIVIRGKAAVEIVKKAINLLEINIDYHQNLLNAIE